MSVKIARDPATGTSKGYGFVSYTDFEAADAAIDAMNGQFLMNKAVTVQYAFKKDGKGERHGTPAERLLAAQARKNNALPVTARPPPATLNALAAFGPAAPSTPGMPQTGGAIPGRPVSAAPVYAPGQFAGALAPPSAPSPSPGMGIPPPPPGFGMGPPMMQSMGMPPQMGGMPPPGFGGYPMQGPPPGFGQPPPPPPGFGQGPPMQGKPMGMSPPPTPGFGMPPQGMMAPTPPPQVTR